MTEEGMQEVHGTGTQEMVLSIGKGRASVGSTEQRRFA